MSHLILLESIHYRRMLWKNGAGITEEICRYPDHDPFFWRLSIAHVAESGSFSLFSGYQRVISVLEGKGIKLKIDDQLLAPLMANETLAFSGDSQVNSELLDGPIQDFNLIYQPDCCAIHFQWLLNHPNRQAIFTAAPTVFLFNATQTCLITVTDQPTKKLNKFDTLWLKNPEKKLHEIQVAAHSQCAFIEIWPH